MDTFKTTRRLIYIIIALIATAIVIGVLVGKNGIIQQERDKYNETHVEENDNVGNQVSVNNAG